MTDDRITTERVRALLSAEPGRHGGTLLDTTFLHDLAADLLDSREALARLRNVVAVAELVHAAVVSERDTAKADARTALLTGVSRPTAYHWASGKRPMPPSTSGRCERPSPATCGPPAGEGGRATRTSRG